MPDKAIMAEIVELQNISKRLIRIAEEHPNVTETLLTIAANVSNAATILAVLVETKLNRAGGPKSTQ
jgi:hypothetical protein